MKKENNYISTDMNHKKLIVGVVIIHVCFMLIGASGIISTLKEKNIFYGLLINIYRSASLFIIDKLQDLICNFPALLIPNPVPVEMVQTAEAIGKFSLFLSQQSRFFHHGNRWNIT
jgi:hypothetical protein